MKRTGSWFFDGYKAVLEPKENGKGNRRVLVYVGEYYGLTCPAGERKKLKRWNALLSAAMLACYLVISLTPASGGMWRFVACPCLLTLVPMIFLVMGLVNYLTAGERWEVRVYYAGYRRLGRAAMAIVFFQLITAVMELVFILQNASLFLQEVHTLLGALFCAGCMAAILWLQKSIPHWWCRDRPSNN